MTTEMAKPEDEPLNTSDELENLKELRDSVLETRYQAEDMPVSLEKELEESTVKITYLKTQINLSIKRYQKRHTFNTRLGIVIKFLGLVLSAVVTILLGLDAASYSKLALVISALISVVAGVSAYFDFNELSLKFKDTVDQLETLQIRLHYMIEGNAYVRINEVEAMMNDYLYILASTQAFFQKVRSDGSDKKGA